MKKTKERLMSKAKEMLEALIEADIVDKWILKELASTSTFYKEMEDLEFKKKFDEEYKKDED